MTCKYGRILYLTAVLGAPSPQQWWRFLRPILLGATLVIGGLYAFPVWQNGLMGAALEHQEGHARIWELLLWGAQGSTRAWTGDTPLTRAITSRDTWMLVWSLGRGADPNSDVAGELTVLDLAIQEGDRQAVCILLACGASVNRTAAENSGSTALMHAARSSTPEAATAMCRLLLQLGANRAARCKEGKTAADIAAARGYAALAEELRPSPDRE